MSPSSNFLHQRCGGTPRLIVCSFSDLVGMSDEYHNSGTPQSGCGVLPTSRMETVGRMTNLGLHLSVIHDGCDIVSTWLKLQYIEAKVWGY